MLLSQGAEKIKFFDLENDMKLAAPKGSFYAGLMANSKKVFISLKKEKKNLVLYVFQK